jgi:poly(A)-specific ribonuclease
MEVTQASFGKELRRILRHIANAAFVALDLEMSGITARGKVGGVGKPSPQIAYDEMRSAAEAFLVMQMGITCVEADGEKGESFPLMSFFTFVPL